MQRHFNNIFLKGIFLITTSILAIANPIEVDIKAQPLSNALKSLAKKTNMQLMMNPTLIKNKMAKPLKGNMEVNEAFKKLLQDTELKLQIKDDIVIIKEKKVALKKSNSNDLGKVEVLGRLHDSSEEKGLYNFNKNNSATKMDLSLLETPQSVSIVTNQKMEDFNLTTLDSVLRTVPGVTVEGREANRTQFTSRGFDVSNILIDGLGLPLDLAYSLGGIETIIYDRIEITKGATALSSGSGDPSATINLITKRPTQEFKSAIDLTVASFDKKRLSADVSGSISENIRARGILAHENGGSNLDRYKYKNNILYSVLEVDLSTNTLLSVGASIYDNNNDDIPFGGLPYHYSNGKTTDYDVKKNPAADWSYWDTQKKEFFLRAEHYINNDWKILASYKHRIHEEDSDLSYISGKPKEGTELGVKSLRTDYTFHMKENIFDLNAQGKYKLFNKEHQGVIGLSLAKNHIEKRTQRASVIIDNFVDGSGKYPQNDISSGTVYKGDFKNKQIALYASTNFNITYKLAMLLGARYSNWETKGYNNNKDNSKKDTGVFTPYFGLVYKISDFLSAYASYTTTFTPNGSVDESFNQIDPTEGTNYELGTKGSFFDNKLNTSFAIFKVEQDNATEKGIKIDGIQTYNVIEGITSKGIEAEISGELIEGLNLSAGYTYLKIKDKDDKKAKLYIPRKIFSFSSSYKVPFHKALKLGASINWQDDIENTFRGLKVKQDSYTIVNLMVNYKFTNNLEASLNINNVTDKKYYTSLKHSQGTYATPRTAFLKLKWTF